MVIIISNRWVAVPARSCLFPLLYAIIIDSLPHPGQSRKDNRRTVLMIRLARIGARKQPYYRVVVIEKDRARNGRSVEVVGTYNPRTSPATIDLKRERIEQWVAKGAKLSDTVAKLMAKPAPAGSAA